MIQWNLYSVSENFFGNSNYIAVPKSDFIEEEIQPILKRKGAEYLQACSTRL